jgi:negative regulator of genetic competence, sporulation and motility
MEETLVLKDVMYCPADNTIIYSDSDQCLQMDVKGIEIILKFGNTKSVVKYRKHLHFHGDLYLVDNQYVLDVRIIREPLTYLLGWEQE